MLIIGDLQLLVCLTCCYLQSGKGQIGIEEDEEDKSKVWVR